MYPLAPQTGRFLLATPLLEGTYFQDRAVFLAEHTDDGTFGLVINKPVHMPLEEVFSGFRSRERKPFSFFLGGPVQEESVYALECGRSVLQGANEVVPGVFLSALPSEDPIPVLDLFSNRATRLHLGYSGWAPGQLESEIAKGCWEVVQPPPLAVLTRDRDENYPTPADFKRLFVLY